MENKEIIAQLESLIDNSKSFITTNDDNDDYTQIWRDDVAALTAAIDIIRSSEWIPVKDKLPEKDQTVLTAIFGSDCITQYIDETFEDAVRRANSFGKVSLSILCEDGWYSADGYPEIITPSYWRPLPTLPKNPLLEEATQ
jgi:Protein of unknown function (DUF551).